MESKTPVRLRRKPMKGGGSSLYLDIYTDGRRSYEFLNLYLVPEHNDAARRQNRQTLAIAEAVRSRRHAEVLSAAHGVRIGRRSSGPVLSEYLEADGRRSYMSLLYNVRRHRIGGKRLGDITPRDFDDFIRSLDVSPNSRHQYAATLKAVLNRAVREGLCDLDTRGMVVPRWRDVEKCYLTADELRRLAATPCGRPEVKRMFLFSALTGLRWSDCAGITWGDVHGDRLSLRQKKTGGMVYADLNGEAVRLMGEPGRPEDHVFRACHPQLLAYALRRWTAAAGIDKHVTFHSARHTFATLSLATGTDIYTVSKMLGHKSVSTTQIYAKVMDRARREAVERLPKIL